MVKNKNELYTQVVEFCDEFPDVKGFRAYDAMENKEEFMPMDRFPFIISRLPNQGEVVLFNSNSEQVKRIVFDFLEKEKLPELSIHKLQQISPEDRYVMLLEKQMAFVLEQQQKSEDRLDKRLRYMLAITRGGGADEQMSQSGQVDFSGILNQLQPLLDLAKKSGLLGVKDNGSTTS